MRAMLVFNDTPKGIESKLIWQHNGCNDGLERSVAMSMMAILTKEIQFLAKRGIVRIVSEEMESKKQ
jgi:hypothetical protein